MKECIDFFLWKIRGGGSSLGLGGGGGEGGADTHVCIMQFARGGLLLEQFSARAHIAIL